LGLAASYAAGDAENFVAVINSWGCLEIAVSGGSAQRKSGARTGDRVLVKILN
jgi:S-adenosylmethionine hydrolase